MAQSHRHDESGSYFKRPDLYDARADVQRISKQVQSVLREQPWFLQPALTCLDYGCGTGLNAIALAQELAWVHAVDVERAMIEHVALKASEMRIGNISTALVKNPDGTDLVGSYDLVLASFVLHHCPHPMVTLRHLLHTVVSGKNGHVAIFEFDDTARNNDAKMGHDFLREEDIRTVVAETGNASLLASRHFEAVIEGDQCDEGRREPITMDVVCYFINKLAC